MKKDHEVKDALKILVQGVVQGVGFRPFIFNLAISMGLTGYVQNTDSGVMILIQGDKSDYFIEKMKTTLPPLADISNISIEVIRNDHNLNDFKILSSKDRGGFTLVSPDICVCDDCIREMETPGDRRYLYPFINCTNCGPRYSITEQVPYDRPNTTMRSFTMCPACEKEYHDPADRRFHAQPNACPACGPGVSLASPSLNIFFDDPGKVLQTAIQFLAEGKIMAIKGIGGFHLVCNAENSSAVKLLRDRKRKNNKPFALMARDIHTIEKYCIVTDTEKDLLLNSRRPIVLLPRKNGENGLLPFVAPGNSTLGFMLPYTPLHRLLFSHPGKSEQGYCCLVMTSGNLSEEPIISENQEAFEKLSGIVDAFLFHNRDIYMAVDDSVSFLPQMPGKGHVPFFIRRARGYTPESIQLTSAGSDVLGAGADLKSTFTLLKGHYAIMSQHIGDMENYESRLFYEKTLSNLTKVFRAHPVAIGYDPHPGYMSNRWVLEQTECRTIPVYHHYAHVASVVAEHGLNGGVIGVIFDGTGYGPDGSLWGGEFFTGNVIELVRKGHLKQIPLPGGESAIRSPWKTAVSLISTSAEGEGETLLERTGFPKKYGQEDIHNILILLNNNEFSPLSSGAGRVFDAIAAITGICDVNTFEAEAPMRLESIIDNTVREIYPFQIKEVDPFIVDLSDTVLSIMDDMAKKTAPSVISARFHNTFVAVILDGVIRIHEQTGINTVVLSGGVFQNRYILEHAISGLGDHGFSVYTNTVVPANDACISLGQAFITREQLKRTDG